MENIEQEIITTKLLISKNIRNARIRTGMSQKEFAEKIGLRYERYCDIENNKAKRITLDLLSTIADGLGVNISELVADF